MDTLNGTGGVAALDAVPLEGLQEELRHRCIAVVRIEYINVLGPKPGTLVHSPGAVCPVPHRVPRQIRVTSNPANGIAQPTIMDHPRITLAPDVLAGKPVIRGTRLSVEFVIGLMADGWSEADILENYPGITHDDILACLAYARDTLSSEKVFPSAA